MSVHSPENKGSNPGQVKIQDNQKYRSVLFPVQTYHTVLYRAMLCSLVYGNSVWSFLHMLPAVPTKGINEIYVNPTLA